MCPYSRAIKLSGLDPMGADDVVLALSRPSTGSPLNLQNAVCGGCKISVNHKTCSLELGLVEEAKITISLSSIGVVSTDMCNSIGFGASPPFTIDPRLCV